ncbi:MAG: energy transducer TonB [Desulfobulbaceae bacterium]|nr:energy transducer TonB [Desulfobulbaceae bacterium]
MARLSLAIVLALGGHLVFFLLALPGGHEELPQFQGIRQVKVRLYRPAPEPVEEFRKSVAEEQPEQDPAVEKIPVETAAPAAPAEIVPRPVKSPEKLQPVARKKISAAEIPAAAQAELEESPNIRRENRVAQGEKKQLAGQRAPAPETAAADTAATVRQAVPLSDLNRPPDYPELARRRGWEGTVLLEVEVAPDGRVRSVRVASGSSYRLLDAAALEAVRGWHFQPGLRDGLPMAMKVRVPVHFVLKDLP